MPGKSNKNLKLEGVFTAEVPDTTGEVLKVSGASIENLVGGWVNVEHINPPDMEKSDIPDDFKGFTSVIGIITDAHKIFSNSDCRTEKELEAWKKIKKPLIYGHLELFTDPAASHPNSLAAAAIAKALHNHSTGKKLGLSVEGATLKRNGNELTATVLRQLAMTLKPANRAAYADISEANSNNLIQKSEYSRKYKGEGEPLYKSVDMSYISVVKTDYGIAAALQKLNKALTAGSPTGAPGSLTQGDTLQSSSHLRKLAKFIGKKRPKKEEILKAIPNLKEDEAEKIEKALKDFDILQKMSTTSAIYNDLKKR